MKLLFENWRRYINELATPQYSMTADTLVKPVGTDPITDPTTAKFTGILKLVPSTETLEEIRLLSQTLPAEAVILSDDKLHVTLVHQSHLKPYRSALKALSDAGELPVPPKAVLKKEWDEKLNDDLGRRSWSIELVNQDVMRGYVNEVMTMIGGQPDPEPERVFHISLANLTGNPGDSVR
tara:strand:+ start:1937 stop:2476 length:540 start_codon:yes stop_codon:yes gene_type:complete